MNENKTRDKKKLLKNSAIIKFLLFLSDWVYSQIGKSLTAFIFTGYEKCEEHYKKSFFYRTFQGYEKGVVKNIVRTVKKKIVTGIESSAIINGIINCADNLLAVKAYTAGAFLISFGFYSSIMYFLKIFILGKPETLAVDLITGVSLMVFGGLMVFSRQSLYDITRGSRICGFVFFRLLGFSEKRGKAFAERLEKPVNAKNRNILFFLAGMIFGILTYFIPPVYICLIFAGVVMLYAVLCYPEAGFLAILFALPFLPTMVLAGMCILVSMCYFLKLIRGKRTLAFEIFDLFVLMFCALIFFGGFVSVSRTGSIRPALIYLCFTLIYFTGVNIIRAKEMIMRCVAVASVSGFFVAAYGIYQNFFGVPDATWHDVGMFADISGRVVSTFENPNVLAKYLILVIPFVIVAIVLFKRPEVKIPYTAGLVCMGLCLIYTWSRGAWLACMAAGLLLLMMMDKRVVAVYAAAVFAVPFAPAVLPESVIRRFTSIGNIADSSTSYRLSIWQGTIRMLRDHFFEGIGIGIQPFITVYPAYALAGIESAPHSHSLYLQILVEFGIAGAVVFAFLIFFFAQCCFTAAKKAGERYLKLFAAAGFCAVFGFLVMGFTDFVWYNYRVYLMFWLVLAVTVGTCRFALRNQPADKIL